MILIFFGGGAQSLTLFERSAADFKNKHFEIVKDLHNGVRRTDMKGEKNGGGEKKKKKKRISGAPSQGAAYRAVGSMRFAR